MSTLKWKILKNFFNQSYSILIDPYIIVYYVQVVIQMMNYIWGIIILISFICAIITGRMDELSKSILNGASDAVTLLISMFGMMCLWTGLMKIADKGGLTDILSKIFSPLLNKIFKNLDKDGKALKAICMNITANLLGIGNAATPMGILAMKELQKLNKDKKTASSNMITFVVLNTASIQLIPTMLIILRQNYQSASPFGILLPVWITSISSLIIGVLAAKAYENRRTFPWKK